MNNRDVAHCWAHQRKHSGKGSNFFFEGAVIYSYGRHFPIARIEGDTVWFTTKTYSISTSKHISYARWAIPADKTIVYVPNVLSPESGIDHYRELIKAISKRRKTAKYYNDLANLVRGIDTYASVYPPAECLRITGDLTDVLEKAKEAERLVRELQVKRLAGDIEKWQSGELAYISVKGKTGRDYLRVLNDQVNTSQGVNFPISDAVMFWRYFKGEVLSGDSLDLADQRIPFGPYKLDKIVEGDVIAGCHHIDRSEVIRFAKSINLSVTTND